MALWPCHQKVQEQIHFSLLIKKIKRQEKKVIDFTAENNFRVSQSEVELEFINRRPPGAGERWFTEQSACANMRTEFGSPAPRQHRAKWHLSVIPEMG